MSAYESLAACYDELTYDIRYEKTLTFFERLCAREHVQPHLVLDLACGTGSLSMLLAEHGYRVIGADLSEEMLAEAEQKARDLPEDIRPFFICQPMQRLRLAEPADAVICALDSLNYLMRPDDCRKTFRRVYDALKPGGLFVFDINTPAKLRGLDGQVFRPIEFEESFSYGSTEVAYRFTAQNEDPVYLYMSGGWTYANVTVNGNYIAPYFSGETKGALYIGSFSSGETVEIKVCSNSSNALDINRAYLYNIDSDYFAQSIEKLQAEGFYDTQQLSNGLTAKLKINSSKVCFTSIPYAKGFTVKINGQAAESFAYADTFLAFSVPAGESSVEIRFVSPGFYIGLIVSLLTAVILLSLWIITKRKQKKDL